MKQQGYLVARNRAAKEFFTSSSAYDRPQWIVAQKATAYRTIELAENALKKLLKNGAYEARIVSLQEALEFEMPDSDETAKLPSDEERAQLDQTGGTEDDLETAPPDDAQMVAGGDPLPADGEPQDDEHDSDAEIDSDISNDVDSKLGLDPDATQSDQEEMPDEESAGDALAQSVNPDASNPDDIVGSADSDEDLPVRESYAHMNTPELNKAHEHDVMDLGKAGGEEAYVKKHGRESLHMAKQAHEHLTKAKQVHNWGRRDGMSQSEQQAQYLKHTDSAKDAIEVAKYHSNKYNKDRSVHEAAIPVIKFKNSDTEAKVQPTPAAKEETISVPANVMSELRAAITEWKKQAGLTNSRDDDRATFALTVVAAYEELADLLSTGEYKMAQVKMTSWMSPITNHLPTSVIKFIASGGKKPSLKDLFDSKRADKKAL